MQKYVLTMLALTMAMVSTVMVTLPVAAAEPDAEFFWGSNDNVDVGETIALGNRDPREIAANVINVLLGFLGIIAVIIILAGGFKWMTAGGNRDKVDEAKKLIVAGIIGLVIILASYGIAVFVLRSLVGATTGA